MANWDEHIYIWFIRLSQMANCQVVMWLSVIVANLAWDNHGNDRYDGKVKSWVMDCFMVY